MSAKRKETASGNKKAAPRSLAIAGRGINTGADFAALMSSLMSDLIEGRLDANTGNAVCKAGSNMLKVVEMEYRYGGKQAGVPRRVLQLAPSSVKAERVQ